MVETRTGLPTGTAYLCRLPAPVPVTRRLPFPAVLHAELSGEKRADFINRGQKTATSGRALRKTTALSLGFTIRDPARYDIIYLRGFQNGDSAVTTETNNHPSPLFHPEIQSVFMDLALIFL